MPKNVVKAVAGLGAAGVIAVSGAALASSQTSPSGAAPSTTSHAPQSEHKGGPRHGVPVTGAALTKVTDAVKAKDSSITVKVVFAASDGSYDVMATKAGKPAHVQVSKNLATVTVHTGMPGRAGSGGPGGPGDHHGPGGKHRGTPVTGTALADVKSAVTAKDSAVTVERVVKEADGSYHAMGTKAGKHVHIDVSKDLKTVTVKADDGKGRGPGAHGGPRGQAPQGGQAPSSASSASATSAA